MPLNTMLDNHFLYKRRIILGGFHHREIFGAGLDEVNLIVTRMELVGHYEVHAVVLDRLLGFFNQYIDVRLELERN